jgi:putative peptidoglycan lipid II flippase
VREVLSLSGWTVGFVVLNQVAMFVTLALAVHIGGGAGVATAYTYAFIFFQLPFGMIAISVMSTVTPALSHYWSSGEHGEMAHQFGLGLRRMMAGIWPATAGYLVLAGPIMALLLRHGAGAGHGPALTAELLAMLTLGLPGYCTYLLCVRALQSMRDTRTAFFLYLLENGLNVALVFVLTSVIGPRGLGLSLAASYSVASLTALVVLRRRMGSLGGRLVGKYIARSFALAVVMAVAVAAVAAGIGSGYGVGLLEKVAVSVIAGVAVYTGGAALAGGWSSRHASRRAIRSGELGR